MGPGDEVRAVVPEQLDGIRVDRVVAKLFDVTRSTARTLVDTGRVTVEGAVVPASRRVAGGDRLEVVLPTPEPDLVPAEVPFRVRHEDPWLLVVDKPPGVVVHPGAGTREPTLVAGLVRRFPELGALTEHRWGLVHRLDRDTSGLLVVARTADTHIRLQEAMRRRLIGRSYLALVIGVPEGVRGTVDAPIGRHPNHPTRRAVVAGGRPARTHLRRVAEWGDRSLLELTLETGRTHQIRVHLASIGHPVVGDRVYGGGRSAGGAGSGIADPGRQWLHAHRLRLEHPVKGGSLEIDSPLPGDLARVLGDLGAPGSGAVPDR